MSRRSALTGVDREAFIKAQIVSVHKALNKQEVPLKQKHVRVLIVGTHKEKSSSVFWNTISRIQLEKNPIVSWKFCHLLHKLLRDGHPKVVEETQRYTQRIVQLGSFWQHLHTSGYGLANSGYCKLLVNRLSFLKRNHLFPGSLHLSETQINTLINSDVNQSFEIAIEMLDQMDDLLNLQSIVFEAMGVVRWNSLTLQGQCLLAPLILVIVDASKFYDYLVKIIFKLHEQIPADALSGHRERFKDIFRKIKKFFELAANLQYFKYLVTIPTLPDQAPNFLKASDLDTYETPQAVLHADDISESESPPDGASLADESLVDISEPISLQNDNLTQNRPDDKDILIDSLRHDIEDARLNQARLMNEARSRIEQYENRLLQVKHESDHYRQTLDEMKAENDRLRAANVQGERRAVDEARLQDSERRAQNSEQNFTKMKNAYSNLRQEHIQALTKLSNAQKDLTNAEAERLNKEEAWNNLERRLAEMERERSLIEEKARGAASNVDDMQGQLAKCQVEIEILNKTIEDMNANSAKEMNALKARNQELELKVAEAQRERDLVNEKARCSASDASTLSAQLAEHVAEIELLKKSLEDLKKRNHDLELEVHEKKCEQNLVDEKCKLLAASSGELAKCMAELEALKHSDAALKERLEHSVAECLALKQKLEELEESQGREIGEMKAKNQELVVKIREEECEKDIAVKKVEASVNNEHLLTAKLTQCLTELEALKRLNDDLSEKLNQSTNDCQLLRKTLEDLKQRSEQEVNQLAAENQALRIRYEEEMHYKRLLTEKSQRSAENENLLSGKLTLCLAELEALKLSESKLKKQLERSIGQSRGIMQTMEAREQETAKKLDEMQKKYSSQIQALQSRFFEFLCRAIEEFLAHSRDELQSASSISYPIQLALPAIRGDIESLKKLITLVHGEVTPELTHSVTLFAHAVADTIINSAAAAYTVSIQHFEPVHEQCRAVAVDALHSVAAFKIQDFKTASQKELPKLLSSLEKLEDLCLKLPAASGDISTEQLGAILEDEMRRMDDAIQKAVKMIEEMQKKSRATDSGVRLEVNEKILDSCNALMAAIAILVSKSRLMQEEIVALGRGTASPSEFYKRNHQWTEGLLSAAKAVGVAATVLVQCADGAVTGKGKFEHLIVASQEIAASTAQLFVSSRVKADRDSKRLSDLATASRSVNSCTANVVATVKSGQETLSDSQNLDFSHLSLHEAKKEEMESQVKTLELEAELMRERARFAELRKQHYHLASLVANENGTQGSTQ